MLLVAVRKEQRAKNKMFYKCFYNTRNVLASRILQNIK